MLIFILRMINFELHLQFVSMLFESLTFFNTFWPLTYFHTFISNLFAYLFTFYPYSLNIQIDNSHCKHFNSSCIEPPDGRLCKGFLKVCVWWLHFTTWVISFFQIPLDSIKNLEIFYVWSFSQWCFSSVSSSVEWWNVAFSA